MLALAQFHRLLDAPEQILASPAHCTRIVACPMSAALSVPLSMYPGW